MQGGGEEEKMPERREAKRRKENGERKKERVTGEMMGIEREKLCGRKSECGEKMRDGKKGRQIDRQANLLRRKTKKPKRERVKKNK